MQRIPIIKCFFLCFLVAFMSQNLAWGGQDDGYFLSLKQKGQLISLGLIQDSDGVWYNVWVCPGYVPPYRYSKKYFYRTGADFDEYLHAKKYNDLADDSKDAYRWAFDDCVYKFIIKGIPKTWDTNFHNARTRTEKRVFGWWIAYPWAFMEATVESVARIPIGLTGSALASVWGTAIVPVYYMTNSGIKGVWHFSVHTVAIPTVASTWNTFISPPLSLFGQKPSMRRVDGFWVKSLTSEQVLEMEASDSHITNDDLNLLKQWGMALETALNPYEMEYAQIREEADESIKKIDNDRREKEKKISEKETLRVDDLRKDDRTQQILKTLTESGFTADRMKKIRSEIRASLQETGLNDQKKINHIIDLLIKYPPSQSTEKGFRSNKTDPVRRSVDIIKNVEVPHEDSPKK